MFFNRIGSDSMSFETFATTDVSSTAPAADHLPPHKQHRRRAALALAVAVTVPAITGPVGSLLAEEAPGALDLQAVAQAAVQGDAIPAADGEMGGADRLREGVRLYENNQYEESLAMLQQVQPADLSSDRERQQLNDALSRAQEAARQRQDARAAYEAGEQALAAGNNAEAVRQYQAAARNRFADQGTRQKAQERIAVAQAGGGNEAGGASQRATYNEAVADYRAGNLAQARAKFQQLQAAGFKAPLFQKSPQDYLNDIDRQGGGAAGTATVEAGTQTTTVQTDTTTTAAPETGQPAEVIVQAETRNGDAIVAQPEADQTQTTAAAPTAGQRRQAARDAYREGKEAYNDKDFARAREQFETARELGYRPGLFEDSPQKYLARIDRAQQARGNNAGQETTTVETTTVAQTTTTGGTAVTADADAQTALEATARQQSVQNQERVFEAQQLVNQARDAEARNDYQTALRLYTDASIADPNNQAAIQGRDAMQVRVTGGRSTTLTQVERERQILRDEFAYTFDQNMGEFETSLRANEFTTAEAELNQNRVLLASRADILTREESQARAQEIANARVRLDTVRVESESAARQRERLDAEAALREREAEERRAREATVRELIAASKQLIARKEYREASNVLDQVLQLDPQNEYAQSVLPLVQDQFILQQQRRFKEQYTDQLELQLNAAQEKLIPYDDIFRYPDNWPQLSRDRDRLVSAEQNFSPEDLAAQQLLNRKLPEIRFERVGLADAIDFLRDLTGANIYVNWGALQAAGINQDAAVSARLRDVRLSKALNVILQDAGSVPVPPVRLDYSIEDGVITVSTSEDLAQNAIFVPRTYDLNDLLLTPREISDTGDTSLGGGGSVTTGGGGGGGGDAGGGGGGDGGGLFGDEGDEGDEDEDEQREEDVQAIIDLIRASVPEDSWQDNNIDSRGTVTERPRSGVLVIIQTPKNHQTINEILTQLRQARGVQISVETRFLTVSRSFLEDVGVDIDFRFNNDSGGNFSPIVVNQNSSDFTQSPTTPVPVTIGGAATANPAITIAGSFLDDFQANFLIRATQASEQISSVNAPRLTLYNGQEAVLTVVRRQYYVSDLTPVVGSVGLFNPTITNLDTGIVFSVRAAVTPDRKYVDMDLRPSLRSFNRFSSFQFQGEGIGEDDDGDIVSTPPGQVQLPDITVTEVQTYVTVPDGGTLLLGGQTLAGEVEREKGVPGLSKIPFLKRLFTNRSMAKDDQILLILVKPTIIITREREEQAFPLLSTQVAQP